MESPWNMEAGAKPGPERLLFLTRVPLLERGLARKPGRQAAAAVLPGSSHLDRSLQIQRCLPGDRYPVASQLTPQLAAA